MPALARAAARLLLAASVGLLAFAGEGAIAAPAAEAPAITQPAEPVRPPGEFGAPEAPQTPLARPAAVPRAAGGWRARRARASWRARQRARWRAARRTWRPWRPWRYGRQSAWPHARRSPWRGRWARQRAWGARAWPARTVVAAPPPAIMGAMGVVIRLGEQRLYLKAGARRLAFPVATGAYQATPRGAFRVIAKQRWPDWRYRGAYVPGGTPANPLGVCWLQLSQPAWWRGAPIGMHGTNAPWLIGRPVSHGCVRLRNRDALALYTLVPVGCPVWIVP